MSNPSPQEWFARMRGESPSSRPQQRSGLHQTLKPEPPLDHQRLWEQKRQEAEDKLYALREATRTAKTT